MFRILLYFILGCALIACENNKPPAPVVVCDTSGVTYSGTVTPILSANCYRCHGTNSNSGSGGIILQDYNVIKTFALTTTLDGSTGSKLYGNITHAGSPYVNMPFDGGKLSDCDIQKIKKWIDKGAPNN